MTPELPPRVQTLNLQIVPEPSAQLRHTLAQLAWSLNSPLPRVPELLALTAQVDRAALERSLRLAQRVERGRRRGGRDGRRRGQRVVRALPRGEARRGRDRAAGARRPQQPNGAPRVSAVTLRPAAT